MEIRKKTYLICRSASLMLLTMGSLLILSHSAYSIVNKSSPPNILYIFTDDQSHRTVSAYEEAHKWVNTPNIDKLANSGIRFTTCYTGASCQMSRAMMMTGKLQHAIKSFSTKNYPGCDYDPEVQPFWPANFRKHGYKTACIGKWHLGDDVGHGRDWDYSVIWDRGGPKENQWAYYYGTQVRYNGGERVDLGGYSTDRYTELAVDYIENVANKDDKPWFLWLCYGGVHSPFTEADRHEALYSDAPPATVPSDIFGPRPTKPEHLKNYTMWKKNSKGEPKKFEYFVKQYNKSVAALDDGVGKLLEALRNSGQLDNTLIVYTSDQGFAWGQHGSAEKWLGYDANINAPLIFSLNGAIKPNQVCKEPVNGVDIVRTFHSVANIEPASELHGRDMLPLLTNPANTLDEPLIFTHTARLYGEHFLKAIKKGKWVGKKTRPAYIMMRENEYKYIRHIQKDTIEELYNLNEDPDELNNLSVTPEYSKLLSKLRDKAIVEVHKKDGQFVDYIPKPKVF